MIEEIEELGLSNIETKVYIKLLELGASKAGKIIDKTKLQSSTIYHVLGSLIEKGLVSYIIKGKIKYFTAAKPETLLQFLDEKRRNLKEILPELKVKQQLAQNPQKATVYQGTKGFKTALRLILESLPKNSEYRVFTLGEELDTKELQIFFKNFHQRRKGKGIDVRLIAPKEIKDLFITHYKEIGLNVRYTNLTLPTGIFIYQDKVMTVVWKDEPTAFLIQSKENAKRYKEFFEEVWEKSIR